jgi:enoyl-CoA hydratase/carnithine racemase
VSQEILGRVEDGIATVTLNRPDKRNAMNRAILDGLVEWFDRLEQDPAARVVVVRAEGPAFCAGMDLRDLSRQQTAAADPESPVTRVLQKIEGSRLPSIAMVQGDAIAGGCELALHCDLRVMAEGARIGMPLARLGLIVPFPLGQKIVEIVGPAHAREILLIGKPLGARRAHEIGMVHRVVPPEELEATTYAWARQIADNAPLSLAGIKLLIQRAISPRETIPHDDIDGLTARARKSADAQEGVRAMLEKRKPVFRGE